MYNPAHPKQLFAVSACEVRAWIRNLLTPVFQGKGRRVKAFRTTAVARTQAETTLDSRLQQEWSTVADRGPLSFTTSDGREKVRTCSSKRHLNETNYCQHPHFQRA